MVPCGTYPYLDSVDSQGTRSDRNTQSARQAKPVHRLVGRLDPDCVTQQSTPCDLVGRSIWGGQRLFRRLWACIVVRPGSGSVCSCMSLPPVYEDRPAERPIDPAADDSRGCIVVIEDEEDIREVIRYNLVRAGFSVQEAADGERGRDLVRTVSPDLVVLDLMLPKIDGLRLCAMLRREPSTSAIPIVMLTARSDEGDILQGLGTGADDYITKPFSPRELVARVKAVLRRGRAGAPPGRGSACFECGPLVVDLGSHRVTVHGADVVMTATEIRLLAELAARPGQVLSRGALLERLTGDRDSLSDRNVDVHIKSIRRKLGVHATHVQTVRGVGYRLEASQ